MPARLDRVAETWHVYALVPRDSYHDVTLPITTYLACKKSERGLHTYDRAWKRYLLAQQVVTQHPAYSGPRSREPRVLYDPVRDDIYWLFKQDMGISFVVTPRPMPDLADLTLNGDPAVPIVVRVPADPSAGDDEQKAS